jgi:Putative peptidoglycan binding domain
MACYQRGSMGKEVEQLQQQLKVLVLYNGPIDGNYGGGTEAAVKIFQRKSALAVDGNTGAATWGKLFPESQIPEPAVVSQHIADRCLALTGSFETDSPPPECFAGLTGDFDGQGISLGACQWNLGQGSLQPLLQEMDRDHADIVTDLFHSYADEFRRMLEATREAQLSWAQSVQNAHHVIAEPWLGLLKALARRPEFQAIETAHAGRLLQTARTLCADYSVHSERALALMFDIAVQNGSIDNLIRAQIERDFAALNHAQPADTLEVARLEIVANRRAAASRPAYVNDVRNRKLTIANGHGVVHGRHYDLAGQYGITLAPMPN